jgi:hypothetical protein
MDHKKMDDDMEIPALPSLPDANHSKPPVSSSSNLDSDQLVFFEKIIECLPDEENLMGRIDDAKNDASLWMDLIPSFLIIVTSSLAMALALRHGGGADIIPPMKPKQAAEMVKGFSQDALNDWKLGIPGPVLGSSIIRETVPIRHGPDGAIFASLTCTSLSPFAFRPYFCILSKALRYSFRCPA